MPKQINTFGPGQWLVNRFGLKGRYQPVLDETFVPVVVIEDAVDTKLAQALVASIPAKAGDHSFMTIINPAASGLQVIVEAMNAEIASDLIRFTFTNFSLVGATLVTSLSEWRQPALAGVPRATIVAGSQASVTMPAGSYTVRANTALELWAGDYTVVLDPGEEFTIWGSTPNNAWTFSGLLWREEVINPTNIG